jgi:hypothetical protein
VVHTKKLEAAQVLLNSQILQYSLVDHTTRDKVRGHGKISRAREDRLLFRASPARNTIVEEKKCKIEKSIDYEQKKKTKTALSGLIITIYWHV